MNVEKMRANLARSRTIDEAAKFKARLARMSPQHRLNHERFKIRFCMECAAQTLQETMARAGATTNTVAQPHG